METGDQFFDRPILNCPCAYPARHWELNESGQPTRRVLDRPGSDVLVAWATLDSDISRPFPRPASSRIAVNVINHLGDEAMTAFRV